MSLAIKARKILNLFRSRDFQYPTNDSNNEYSTDKTKVVYTANHGFRDVWKFRNALNTYKHYRLYIYRDRLSVSSQHRGLRGKSKFKPCWRAKIQDDQGLHRITTNHRWITRKSRTKHNVVKRPTREHATCPIQPRKDPLSHTFAELPPQVWSYPSVNPQSSRRGLFWTAFLPGETCAIKAVGRSISIDQSRRWNGSRK